MKNKVLNCLTQTLNLTAKFAAQIQLNLSWLYSTSAEYPLYSVQSGVRREHIAMASYAALPADH